MRRNKLLLHTTKQMDFRSAHPDTKDHIMYDSVYTKFWNKETYLCQKNLKLCLWGCGTEPGTKDKIAGENFLGWQLCVISSQACGLYICTHLLKFTKLYISLNINYISIKSHRREKSHGSYTQRWLWSWAIKKHRTSFSKVPTPTTSHCPYTPNHYNRNVSFNLSSRENCR